MPTSELNFSVKFSQAQRRVVAKLLPDLTDRLQIDIKNQRTIRLTINEIEDIHDGAEEMVSQVTSGLVRKSLRHIMETTAKARESAAGIGRIPASQRLYQFRISLIGIEPEIWRRIQVRGCTFHRFHEYIQTAMGWTNSHLHRFEISGVVVGEPELLVDDFEGIEGVDSTVTKLSEMVPKSGKRFRFQYKYDFGDLWQHEVLFEGCLPATKGQRYPICIEGARACPPEGVGGASRYPEFIEILSTSDHGEHDSFLEWSGPFDPEYFDPIKMTKKMRQGLPDWRKNPAPF